jgi:hypothetical protein
MIVTLPSVQSNYSRCKRYACLSSGFVGWAKRNANRRHRRALNRATRMIWCDPERWWDEGFNAPSLSSWDLW